eukprot:TRINITY_DN16654_c0_g2_i1.p1 TRINITY_DN16654_c0_g2~~TRINITY_DN16654_c0_g2_i1.p1  ORF type:complete len:394 (+),score=-58.54 TRINITY_DN16654_c0_g2_i1:1483-2664(+)
MPVQLFTFCIVFIARCNIRDEGLIHLATALDVNHTLSKLDLGILFFRIINRIQQFLWKGCRTICGQSAEKQLTHRIEPQYAHFSSILIDYNTIYAEGGKVIGEMLEKNKRLTSLSMRILFVCYLQMGPELMMKVEKPLEKVQLPIVPSPNQTLVFLLIIATLTQNPATSIKMEFQQLQLVCKIIILSLSSIQVFLQDYLQVETIFLRKRQDSSRSRWSIIALSLRQALVCFQQGIHNLQTLALQETKEWKYLQAYQRPTVYSLTYASVYTYFLIFLEQNRIGDKGGLAIGLGLQTNNALTKLDICIFSQERCLAYNEITGNGAKAIITALKDNKTLEHLDLSSFCFYIQQAEIKLVLKEQRQQKSGQRTTARSKNLTQVWAFIRSNRIHSHWY